MMAKNPRRPTALALAVAFALMLGGEAAGAHPCLHHDGLPSAVAETEAHARSAAGHRHHAPAEENGAHRACTCVGVCQLGASPATPASSAAFADPEAGPLERPAASVITFLQDAPRLLPFAHAPPAALSSF